MNHHQSQTPDILFLFITSSLHQERLPLSANSTHHHTACFQRLWLQWKDLEPVIRTEIHLLFIPPRPTFYLAFENRRHNAFLRSASKYRSDNTWHLGHDQLRSTGGGTTFSTYNRLYSRRFSSDPSLTTPIDKPYVNTASDGHCTNASGP